MSEASVAAHGLAAARRAAVHKPVAANDEVTPAARTLHVADVRKGELDHRGEVIQHVFYWRRNFAIYRSGDKVMVHYSDDEAEERTQVAAIAELVSLRGRLQFLMTGMKRPNAYHCQIAEALRLCLDGRKQDAKRLLKMLIDIVIERRRRKGRDFYLMSTGAMVFVVIAILCAAAASMWSSWHQGLNEVAAGLQYLMLAAGGGTTGAMLSTSLALQARNGAIAVKADIDPRWNAVDGAVRIWIGVISAAALYLVLDSNFLDNIKLGPVTLRPDIDWKGALLVGFAAGFLERLVPDLLAKAAPDAK